MHKKAKLKLDENGLPDRLMITCASCGHAFSSPYCPECGERRPADRHYDLRHFFHEVLEILFHVDHTLPRTFKTLLVRPGGLTSEFMEGRRKPYLGPLQLFLIVNLLFFLVQSFVGIIGSEFDVLTSPLQVHTRYSRYRALASGIVERKITDERISYDKLQLAFNHSVKVNAKSLVVVMVPVFALGVALLNLKRRRFVVEHLVFSLHFFAAFMLFISMIDLFVAILLRLPGRIYNPLWGNRIIAVAIIAAVMAYLFRALKRAYSASSTASATNAVLLTLFMIMIVLPLYSFILFLVTLHSV
jgi:hypothetical protein